MVGSDTAIFLESDEFKTMVESVREIGKVLGEVSYNLSEKMRKGRDFFHFLFIIKHEGKRSFHRRKYSLHKAMSWIATEIFERCIR